jgi:hypothetical protein
VTDLAASRVLRAAFAGDGFQDDAQDALDRLLSSYLSFKKRATELAAEIERSFSHLTVHDEEHLDALWQIVDLIVPSGMTLNPVEAYLLGGAILLHDLGLSVAAYPNPAVLREEPRWTDSVTSVFERRAGRRPRAEELNMPDAEIIREAEELLLRQLHAKQAEALATVHWLDDRGEQRFLIEDPDIRRALGVTIGRLAHSHWWETSALPEHFNVPLGSPAWAPGEWSADLLKLAALLRVADAMHLDSRRAPMFVRTLRQPTGWSATHWAFQERLANVMVEDDRVVFTSGDPFSAEDAQAWWLCFETLQDVDRWLREVDALLADLGRPRLAVRAVRGVEDPQRLARLIPTVGWSPVDTHVRVSNLAGLVQKLGGEQLYGRAPKVAVRELIQNGADAVRARRTLLGQDVTFGQVVVRAGVDDEGQWIEVEDNGVGMTEQVLTRGLLDFGTSFWAASELPAEFPGLLSSGFDAAGRFGIGFFSVFMLGEHVRVTTRPFRMGEADTSVLEFLQGVGERPLLRAAHEEERLVDGGTRVRVWLGHQSIQELFDPRSEHVHPIAAYCESTCLTLDVTVVSVDADGARATIPGDRWQTLDGSSFARAAAGRPAESDEPDPGERFGDNLRDIRSAEGQLVARLAVAPRYIGRRGYNELSRGAVTAGGLRASALTGVIGVALGQPVTAARDVAFPEVDETALSAWATGQAELVKALGLPEEDQADAAQIIRALGGDTGELQMCLTAQGWFDRYQLAAWAASRSTIVIIQDAALSGMRRDQEPFELGPNVIAVAKGLPGILQTPRERFYYWPAFAGDAREQQLDGVIFEAAAEEWNTTPAEIRAGAQIATDDEDVVAEIGRRGNAPVEYHHLTILHRTEG